MGRLEMIIGPMFSGKTSTLIEKVLDYKQSQVFVITHSCDDRYGKNAVINHDGKMITAFSTPALLPLLNTHFSKDMLIKKPFQIVAIDEGQFFDDLEQFVKICVEELDLTVWIMGLDGDYERKPFKNITDLIPYADTVQRLYAKCYVCANPASFSKRIVSTSHRILVGSSEFYAPSCRLHFS